MGPTGYFLLSLYVSPLPFHIALFTLVHIFYFIGSELLVWYGEDYAEHLGINLDGSTTEGSTSVNGGRIEYP